MSDFYGWTPYYPNDYPITDGTHNPWVVVDPISGMTSYQVWLTKRPINEEDFRRVLRELKGEKDECDSLSTYGENMGSTSWSFFRQTR